jgi:DNA-binding MarR family transcriptional regulator
MKERHPNRNPLTLCPGVWKSLIHLFNLHNQIMNERIAAIYKREGIEITVRDMLIVLAASEGAQSQRDIASVLNVNDNVLVRSIDALEKKGYVKREQHKDRRRTTITVLPKAQKLLKTLRTDWERRYAEVFHPVPVSEVRTISGLVRLIIDDYYEKKSEGPRRRIKP